MKQKSRNRWGRFLLVWALILLILGAVGCFVLYRFLGVYEVTRPEMAVDTFLAGTDADSLAALAKENVDLPLTPFEDADQLYADYLESIDLSKPLSYRPDTRSSTADHQVYVIRAGSRDLCSVILTPEGKSPGFGRYAWTVSEVKSAPITDHLSSVMIEIEALSGQEVSLNGVPLPSVVEPSAEASIEDLTPLEASFDPVPVTLRYETGPLYGDVRVTDETGRSLAAVEEKGGSVLRYVAATPTHSLRIQAPDDLTISVSGRVLTESDASRSGTGVLEGLEDYTGSSPQRTVEYAFDRLYSLPVVTATDEGGNEVLPLASTTSSYVFIHESDPEIESQFLPLVQRFFEAYMAYTAHAFDYSLYNNLINFTLPGTNLYNYFSTTRDTMLWAGSSTDEAEVTYAGFHEISPTCFVCTVIYDVSRSSVYWGSEENTVQSGAYEIAFISTGGNWYAAAMNIISL